MTTESAAAAPPIVEKSKRGRKPKQPNAPREKVAAKAHDTRFRDICQVLVTLGPRISPRMLEALQEEAREALAA